MKIVNLLVRKIRQLRVLQLAPRRAQLRAVPKVPHKVLLKVLPKVQLRVQLKVQLKAPFQQKALLVQALPNQRLKIRTTTMIYAIINMELSILMKLIAQNTIGAAIQLRLKVNANRV